MTMYYAIIPTAQVARVIWSEIPECSDTLRQSLDGTQSVIKWRADAQPSFIGNGSVIPTQILNHSQARALMSTSDWSNEE